MRNAHQVAPDLWVGAMPRAGDYRKYVDVIVFVADEYQPSERYFPGVIVRHFPFNDSLEPSERDMQAALRAASAVAKDLELGRRVLVTCRKGRNRSGFVAALALHLHTGEPGRRALRQVRARRRDEDGVHAIENPAFQQYLMVL